MNYQVADFIIQIKNAYLARRKEVTVRYSNLNFAIGKALIKAGFLASIKEETIDGHRKLVVALRYEKRKPAFHDVEIVSKPSLRVYVESKEIIDRSRAVTPVLSTSMGVLLGKDAVKKGV